MSNFHFADLLYTAIVWADFLGGFIVGICLMALPIIFFWPRTSESVETGSEKTDSDRLQPVTTS